MTKIGSAMTALALSSMTACAQMLTSGRPAEYVSTSVSGVTYNTIAVIAADDANSSIQISQSIRSLLNQRGVNAIARRGRWESEQDALLEICRTPPGQEAVQGVVIVSYDTLILRECQTREVAYRIQGGGGLTLSEMADRVARYVRTGSGSGRT